MGGHGGASPGLPTNPPSTPLPLQPPRFSSFSMGIMYYMLFLKLGSLGVEEGCREASGHALTVSLHLPMGRRATGRQERQWGDRVSSAAHQQKWGRSSALPLQGLGDGEEAAAWLGARMGCLELVGTQSH